MSLHDKNPAPAPVGYWLPQLNGGIMRRIIACSLVLLSLTFVTDVGAAGRGVQGLPDNSGVLVTKDVGNERWSITLDWERETVSGNVFRTNGDPAFVWCIYTGDDGNEDLYQAKLYFGCFGADRCTSTPCVADEQWRVIGPVEIPGSFFLP